jgi:hypothetical protein
VGKESLEEWLQNCLCELDFQYMKFWYSAAEQRDDEENGESECRRRKRWLYSHSVTLRSVGTVQTTWVNEGLNTVISHSQGKSELWGKLNQHTETNSAGYLWKQSHLYRPEIYDLLSFIPSYLAPQPLQPWPPWYHPSWGCHPRFPSNLCFYRDEVVSLMPQPPTWRTRISLLVWQIAFDLSCMGGPTGNLLPLAMLSGSSRHASPTTMTK